MSGENQNKVMTTQEAIRRFVNDGDHVVIGNYTVGTCYNQITEIVRQRKKGLTIYSQSGVFDVEMLIAGDCVSRVVTTYCIRSGGRYGGSMLERYQTGWKDRGRGLFELHLQCSADRRGPRLLLYASTTRDHGLGRLQGPGLHGRKEVRGGQVPLHRSGRARSPCSQPGRLHRSRAASRQVRERPILGFPGFGVLGLSGQQKGGREL